MDSVADVYANRVVQSELYLVEQGAAEAEKASGKRLVRMGKESCKRSKG